MRMIDRSVKFALSLAGAGALALAMAGGASAYDGTNCKAPGNCWEPKPGYPDKVAGSKYDPKHDPKELNKQSESIKAMEQRNAQRVENFKKTGKFVFDVSKISAN
ncbi:Methanol dehydrogenase [cytochrome c] subunit 2 [Starkeya nomas]|uniref:Methanol dehydrogenase [cytochrome c] subunit 2 n=2 Tax=Xanthobacteraceae TaxID=335928 RepID=A0A5S9P6V9_9HYPH|nr:MULTISPECIES: methanol dehydrogenase [cytochrome c] subunit [Xanthobacteraceae]TSJ63165.1 methanol dehydrogenase [Ancylobacter moscoviensis]CAA0099153.1 Methanol dehydrogenase [cytochrome c] subunit 2 [Starkeya nomas]